MENPFQNNQPKSTDGSSLLLIFLSGILGMSLGYVVFFLDWFILAVVISIFSSFLILGLILNKRLIEQNNLIFSGFQQEATVRKNNILSAFIKELEGNFEADRNTQFRAITWKNLKLELCSFPDSLYEIVEAAYFELNKIPGDIQGPELKDYLLKETTLSAAIAALRDQQNKLRRNIIF